MSCLGNSKNNLQRFPSQFKMIKKYDYLFLIFINSLSNNFQVTCSNFFVQKLLFAPFPQHVVKKPILQFFKFYNIIFNINPFSIDFD
jgi:hypothetical protein